jgi:hypothetical protein
MWKKTATSFFFERGRMSIEEIEAKRAARKEAIAKARDEQYEKDLVEVDRLEIEHGDDRVGVLKVPSFVSGLPTLVVVKTPDASKFNRFRTRVRKAAQNTEAIGAAKDELASSCLAYPDEATYTRMKDAWPSIHDNVGLEAIRLGEAEGKG